MKKLPVGHTAFTGGDMQVVKGTSRQVILVRGPETELFEQAIFILKENAVGVSDEMLLKEAKRLIQHPNQKRFHCGPIWACGGALLTGILWLFSIFL